MRSMVKVSKRERENERYGLASIRPNSVDLFENNKNNNLLIIIIKINNYHNNNREFISEGRF